MSNVLNNLVKKALEARKSIIMMTTWKTGQEKHKEIMRTKFVNAVKHKQISQDDFKNLIKLMG